MLNPGLSMKLTIKRGRRGISSPDSGLKLFLDILLLLSSISG
jgi:hypothetical protein